MGSDRRGGGGLRRETGRGAERKVATMNIKKRHRELGNARLIER